MTANDNAPLEPERPSYGTPGRVLVRVTPDGAEVISHDPETSVSYIEEGVGWNYWLEDILGLDQFPGIGWWVVEGVIVTYTPAVTWRESPIPSDADEDFEHSGIRLATPDEMETETLD